MSLTGDKIYKVSRRCRKDIERHLNNWLYEEDSKRRISLTHISIQDAYEQILKVLFAMDDRFYKIFDAQELKRDPTDEDWREFAVSELTKMFDIIYYAANDCKSFNDESVHNDHSNFDKQSTWIFVDSYKKTVNKMRESCANSIWLAWTHERSWCPRLGRIIISNNKTDLTKVLLVYCIRNNALHYGFPKGKPNYRESIHIGSNRETSEETGLSVQDLCMYTGQKGTKVIGKRPYIGAISKRRNRLHYYVITTTSVEFTTFKPQKYETEGVLWYPINRIPCCDDCLIRQKQTFNDGQDIDINFHLVTLRNVDNENPVILDILNFIDEINGNQDASLSYLHVHRRCKHDLLKN